MLRYFATPLEPAILNAQRVDIPVIPKRVQEATSNT